MVKQLIRLFWKTGIWARVAGAGLAILLAGVARSDFWVTAARLSP